MTRCRWTSWWCREVHPWTKHADRLVDARRKGLDDKVTGATINNNGSLVIEAGKVRAATMLAQIVAMVSGARR